MAELKVENATAGYKGLNTDSSQAALAKGASPNVANFLVHRDEILPMRGPIVEHPELAIGSDELVTGVWTFNDKLLVGRATKSASSVKEPWTAPYRKAGTAGELAEPDTTQKFVALDFETVADVASTAATVIGGRSARLGSYAYGYSYGANQGTNPAVLENGGYVNRRRLLRWDGTAAAPTEYVNAPEGGQDVRTHLDRLWVLGGRDVPGGAPGEIQGNYLYWSDQGGPTADTTAMWKDDVSNLVNKIVVDSDDQSDFGVGLAKVGQNLVIFKRRSIYVLYGFDKETFTLRTFTTDVGCIDRRSIVEYDSGCYFLSDRGYMYFDGTSLTNVSEGLQTTLNAEAALAVGSPGVDGGRAVAGKLAADYLLLAVSRQNTVTGAQESAGFCATLHTPTGRWAYFSSNALNVPTPHTMGTSASSSYLIDGDRMVKANALTRPETVSDSVRGFDAIPGTQARIPAAWWSPILKLASAQYMAQLHRVFVDHALVLDDNTDQAVGSGTGWFVIVVAGNGDTLLAEYQVDALGDPSAYLFRRRHVADAYAECADCQIRVEWRDSDDTYPALARADLYAAGVEYHITRQRRSA